MGFFDSDSTTTNTQQIHDESVAVESVSGNVYAGVRGNVIDAGAIPAIENVALHSMAANRGILSEAIDQGEELFKGALFSIGAAFEQAGAQTQRVLETTTGGSPSSDAPLNRFDIQQDLIRYGALALVAGIALYAYFNR